MGYVGEFADKAGDYQKKAKEEHAPRAARDVRELGIPLVTFKIKDRNGKI